MINAPDDSCRVPWDDLWDSTIEEQVKQGTIGLHGDPDNPRGGWTLFAPRRLLVDARATDDPAVKAALKTARAVPLDADDRESARARDIAQRLGLALYEADDDRLVDAVRAINGAIARSASLDHVLIGGPARWGGDSVPVPIDDPGTVPGRDPALGKGVTVAVLDTGIAPGIGFAVDAGQGGNAEVPDEDADGRRDAPAGHGTHVAGLVASVAAGAHIVARRILRGVAGIASDLFVAGALLDSAETDIVNCSFSGPGLDDGAPLAVERALGQLAPSTVVVACAGNHGTDRPQWPAAFKGVIAVGAIMGGEGGWRQPDFTNFGWWVDCCAPGVDVESAFLRREEFDGFARWSGTSMSCPQVAGAIAAIATRDGIDVSAAAYKLVHDPVRPRMPGLGAIVDPRDLP